MKSPFSRLRDRRSLGANSKFPYVLFTMTSQKQKKRLKEKILCAKVDQQRAKQEVSLVK